MVYPGNYFFGSVCCLDLADGDLIDATSEGVFSNGDLNCVGARSVASRAGRRAVRFSSVCSDAISANTFD